MLLRHEKWKYRNRSVNHEDEYRELHENEKRCGNIK